MRNTVVFFLLFASLSVFSQEKILIYKSNHQVDAFKIASIDSICIVNDQVLIYQTDDLTIGYLISFIDSIKINDTGNYDPVLDAIFPPTYCKKVITDDGAGIPVWQLTDGNNECAAPYFEHQAFTDDDKYAVFRIKHNNQWRIYRSELRTGLVSLLSNRPLISPDGTQTLPFSSATTDAGLFTVMPNGKEVAFLAGAANARKLYAVDVASRTERVLFDVYTEINRLYGTKHDDLQFSASFTNDGRYTLIMSNYKTADRTEIFRLDLTTQEIELVATGPYKSTHPVLHPENPNQLFYIPEPDGQDSGAPDNSNRARNWLITVSGSDLNDYTVKGLTCRVKGTAEPFLWMPVGNRATHETWSADGEKMFYFKKGNGNDVSVCSRSINDAAETVYTTLARLGHGTASPDMKYFVSDQQMGANTNNSLYLIDLETKTNRIISNPNATNSNGSYQYQHVHPSFSRSGNYVIYSSDRRGNGYDGKYQVFVVPLEKILQTY